MKGPETEIPLSRWMIQESIIRLCTGDSSVDPKLPASWKTTMYQEPESAYAVHCARNSETQMTLDVDLTHIQLEILD